MQHSYREDKDRRLSQNEKKLADRRKRRKRTYQGDTQRHVDLRNAARAEKKGLEKVISRKGQTNSEIKLHEKIKKRPWNGKGFVILECRSKAAAT